MIRNAESADCPQLTEIAFRAKSFWNYPEDYLKRWEDELTISAEYLNGKIVRCDQRDGKIVGFYSVFFMPEPMTFGSIHLELGYWLDHMFILPEYHRQGIGSSFFRDLSQLKDNGQIQNPLRAFVDPHAVGFYLKMGAKEWRVSDSSIPHRTIPVMGIEL